MAHMVSVDEIIRSLSAEAMAKIRASVLTEAADLIERFAVDYAKFAKGEPNTELACANYRHAKQVLLDEVDRVLEKLPR